MKPAVFLSYAHVDRAFASALSAQLSRNAEVWLDREMRPGDHISATVSRELSDCDRVVLCASRSSLLSSWVNEELLICLKREKLEHRSILVVVAIDDFLSNEWPSSLASYLNDRLLVDCQHVPAGSRAFKSKVTQLRNAIRRSAEYSPLLHGTWGYVIKNKSKTRVLIGAFRLGLEGSSHSLCISRGVTFKMSEQGARTLWLIWQSQLVAYNGKRLGFFYDGILQASNPEYARNVCAAWLLEEEADMLGFNGFGYPLGMNGAGSDVLVQAKRLNVRREDRRDLETIVESLNFENAFASFLATN